MPATGPSAPGTASTYADLVAGIYNSPGITLTAGQQSALQLDASGNLLVNLATPLPAGSNVIGAVNQGTSPWVVTFDALGSATGGTAAAQSDLAGGIYNSTPPTLTNGQQSALQLNSSGALVVSATLSYDTNYGTVGANTLRTAAQIGNATGAADFNAGATGAQTLRVSANQGAAAALSGAWPMEITDGTHGPAAVKAPSTAAVAADSALVVALSPNSPLPAGSNVIGAVTQSGGPWTTNLTEVGGSAIALGQTTMANSIPVVIASNQSAITVNQGTSPWVVSGTVAVTQSTSPWVVTFDALGSQSGGTAAAQSDLAGGIYNSPGITLTAGQQASLQLDAAGNLLVDLATPIPAGTNLIGGTTVYVGSTVASVTNPLPVTITSNVPGTAIQSYQTFANLAAGASHTFTYTVAAGHTFSLERVWSAASGKIKSVVAVNASTIFVGFNSTANPNIDITVTAPPTIAAAGTVTVTITNNDLMAFDCYVTIEGNQN
jgi:hypothetical protein